MADELFEIKVPFLGVNDEQATLVAWLFEAKASVNKGDIITTLETTKATQEIAAEHNGFLYPLVTTETRITPEQIIGVIINAENHEELFQEYEKTFKAPQTAAAEKSAAVPENLKFTRKAQALALQYQVDVTQLPQGKIIREVDVLKLVESTAATIATAPLPVLDKPAQISEECYRLLLHDAGFGKLSSDSKIAVYKKFGAAIGQNVTIGNNSRLISHAIEIGDNVHIGEDCYIETDTLMIASDSRIGNQQQWVASKIQIGSGFRAADHVAIDVSGGKSFESVLEIGKDCLLCEGSYLNVCKQITLEDHVCLSPRAMIFTHSYWQSVMAGYDAQFAPVYLEKDAWIGGGAQVLPGLRVGSGSTVMANSVVISTIPPQTLVGGVPAVPIKTYRKRSVSFEQLLPQLLDVLLPRLRYQGWTFQQKTNSMETELLITTVHEITAVIFQTGIQTSSALAVHLNNKIPVVLVTAAKVPHELTSETTLIHVTDQAVTGPKTAVVQEVLEAFRRHGIKLHWQSL